MLICVQNAAGKKRTKAQKLFGDTIQNVASLTRYSQYMVFVNGIGYYEAVQCAQFLYFQRSHWMPKGSFHGWR